MRVSARISLLATILAVGVLGTWAGLRVGHPSYAPIGPSAGSVSVDENRLPASQGPTFGAADRAALTESDTDVPPDTARELLRWLYAPSTDTSDYSEDEAAELAHMGGRAILETTYMLDPESEPALALCKLPSVESIAKQAGVEATASDLEVVETSITPRYRAQLDLLGPAVIAEINVRMLSSFEDRRYTLRGPAAQGDLPAPASVAHGRYRRSVTIPCPRTPYTIIFAFDSLEYPSLEATLQQVEDLKSDMRQEVYDYLRSVHRR